MTTTVTGFPNSFQDEYARIPKAPLPGSLWEGELHNERPDCGLIAKVTPVAYAATVTIGNYNAGDEVGITVNGVDVVVTAVTDAAATAALLNTKINAAGLLSGVLSSTVDGAALTLAGALGVAIEAEEYSPDTTTATFSAVTASVVQQQLNYGMGVARDVPSTTILYNKVKKPTSTSAKFAGVLVRTNGTDLPAAQILAAGGDPDYLMPGQVYGLARANCGVVVEYVGTAPVEGDPVYWICSGENAGLWRVNDGSTSQVTSGTVAFNGTDNVGVTVDDYGPVFVASDTDNATTAAALVVEWNSRPEFAAIATASSNSATFTLTFLDDQEHTVVAYSPATADITSIANSTDAVAATAVLMSGFSWGRPSIPGSADVPARAFLRLSNP